MSQESNLPAKPSVSVRGWVNPYHPQATVFGKVMAGTTVADAISKACKASRARKRYMRRGLVYLGRKQPSGDYKWTRIPQENWNKVRLHTGDALTFRLLPTGGGGGKNPFRTILNIVVMAAAVAAAVFTAGTSLFAAGGMLAGATITGSLTVGGLVAGALVGGLVMTMGQMLVDAIAPIKTPSMNTIAADNDDVYSLSASSNSIDKWGRVPILFGKGRIAPKKAAAPYSELNGDDMYLHELFIWGECGTGDIQISDLRIGETSVNEYDNINIETWRFDPTDPWYSKLYPTGIQQEEFSIKLKQSDGFIIRQSKPKASSISIDLQFATLVRFDDKGNANSTSVSFEIGYRKVGASSWQTLGRHSTAGASFTGLTDTSWNRYHWVYIDTGANVVKYAYQKNQPSGILLYSDKYNANRQDWHIVSGFTVTVDTYRESDGDGGYNTYITAIHVSSGVWAWDKGSFTISASSTSAVRRTYSIGGLDGVSAYEVRVKRVTADHDSNSKEDTKIQDDSYWSAIRTHTNDKPFSIDYPAVFTAIKVRATDQLNGSLQNLTGQYQALMKTYNSATKTWEVKATRGLIPAIRFALQECSARPQPDSVIDWDNFIATDAYWNSLGWKYDKVLDSQQSVLSVVQDICAAGLASPTFIDGKWAVIVDKPRDEVVMGITSANSWGWSVDRVTSELPHIIQCDFVNEEHWEADMREIEVDSSYKTEGRTPIVEKVTFDGVTVPDNVYKQARFHYADAKMQVRTISMTMWDESLVATRGDLVSISQPYLMPKDLEAGRIKNVFYDDNGYVTGVTTDIANTINQESGLGIRIYMDDGTTAHAQLAVNQTGDARTQKLVFAETITANIKKGNKYVLGYYSERESLAIIKSMKFNADFSCQLTCVDYIEDKYKVFDPDFVIPPFQSIISRPIYAVTTLTPPPVVQRIVTDESAIIRVGKTLKSRALVYFGVPAKLDRRAISIRCAYRVHNTMTDGDEVVPGKWMIFTTIPVSETIAFCDEVEEGQYYDFRFQYVSAVGYTSEWTQVDNIEIIGKTSLPPSATEVHMAPHGASGMRTYWPATDIIDFDHYKLVLKGEGFPTWTGVTQDLELITPIWKWTGILTAELYLVDVLGLVSAEPATTTYNILPPATPEVVSDILNNTFILSWQECNTTWPIKYYKVEDPYLSKAFNVADEWTSVEARKADTIYQFSVTSVDVFDNAGETTTVDVYIPGIAAFLSTAVVEGDMVKISWVRDFAPFDIDYFEIESIDDGDDTVPTHIAQVKGNTYSVPVEGSGTKNYRVRAVDIAGNVSPWSECNANIEPPYAPMSFTATIVDDHIELAWADPYKGRPSSTRLPILSYDIIRQWTETRDDGLVQTMEEDYGTYDALALSVPAVPTGKHTFMVRARDTGGNTGAWALAEIEVFDPNRVMFYNCSSVDNNVMLYWQEPKITSFPMQAYILYEVDEYGYYAEIGRTDSLFSAQIENAAGQYTYGVRAMDVAGNMGEMSIITMWVAQPPDFIMYHDYDSVFNGTKENIVLSGDGYMFGPVVPDETWDENVIRVSEVTGVAPDDVTWQTKIDNNHNYFMSPYTDAVAMYMETIDVGVEVPSTKITITPTSIVMEGDPTMVCKIEVSQDGVFWREMSDNAFAVYATAFRYVRATLTWTGGMYRIDNINFKLDVKRINDAGRIHSDKDDNGEGWISMQETPMLTGTWVPFNIFFTDVESLPRPNIINDIEGYTAFTVFEDNIYPTGFRVFVLDKDGNRVSADVDWSAFGV